MQERTGPACLLLLLAALMGSACAPRPGSAEIEAMGVRASQARQPAALAQLQAWSQAGNAVAQRELALALLREKAARWPEGLDWLRRAALGADAEAAYLLGEATRLGRHGLRPDAGAARPWLEQAARAGHADAALALARLWLNGDGVGADAAAGLHWLQAASQGGNPQAMLLLSQAYAQGRGTAPSQALARHWLEAAADKHHPAAIQAYALALQNGELGLAVDGQLADELLAEATAERHNRWNAR